MDNKNLIFITGHADCGKAENAEVLREFYRCESVLSGLSQVEVNTAISNGKGPFLVLTANMKEVIDQLFPGSRVIGYRDACREMGISPFHGPDGQLIPALRNDRPLTRAALLAATAAAPEPLRSAVESERPAYGVLMEVARERARQIGKGFDASHDDLYTGNELAQAGIAYALASLPAGKAEAVLYWPWAPTFWHPEGQRANLIKAAALLVAEVQRIDRAIAATGSATIDIDLDSLPVESARMTDDGVLEITPHPTAKKITIPPLCDKAPTGYQCTRAPGHDGPCAAEPDFMQHFDND